MVHVQVSKVLHYLVEMTMEALVLKKMLKGSIDKKLLTHLADLGESVKKGKFVTKIFFYKK